MARLRVSVLGHTGRGGFGHQVLDGFRESEVFDVVEVVDLGDPKAPVATGADERARRIEQALVPKPDVLVVAQRFTDSHEEAVMAALEAGCHVYCEKPLSQDLASADRISEAAARHDRLVAVGLPAVHEERYGMLERHLSDGLVGELYELRGLTKWDGRGGGEDALILGLHLTDLMIRIAGLPRECFGRVYENGRRIDRTTSREAAEGGGRVAGSHFRAHYEFDRGVVGSLLSVRAGIDDREIHPYRLEIRGTEGFLSYRAPYADGSVWHYPYPEVLPGADSLWRPIHVQRTPYGSYHRWAALDMWAAIEDGRRPKSDVHSYSRALEMIHAPYWSSLRGGVVELPLHERSHPLDQAI